ncbi:MerR family transcriptional regulator [Streptomyces sp. NPDC001255]|uniref:MerR family transcriptional regulator n=1 Tax=Streptomyces sp. NPDC001255 TaxID=3364550 RepID=UPI0036B16F50
MFTIGDFARHGQVSVRMLRHYDALGLLRPARTDPYTGYRFYTADQLSRLNRVIALKELGFSLQEVGRLLAEDVAPAELRGMLRLRQAQLAQEAAAARARLARVGARLHVIESEGHMSTQDIVVKTLPAVRAAGLTAVAASFDPAAITPVVGPLFDEVCRLLDAAGIRPQGPGIAHYVQQGDEDGPVEVHALFPVGADVPAASGLRAFTLPAVTRAATLVHHGSMDTVLASEQLVGRWLETENARPAGLTREVYLECAGEPATWVTELQLPLAE